jgi:hypothetical protein
LRKKFEMAKLEEHEGMAAVDAPEVPFFKAAPRE